MEEKNASMQDIVLKKNISNIDLFVLSIEINTVLQDGFILNIYEVPDTEFLIFKCRTKIGKTNLFIDPKNRVNLTELDYPIPPFPSQFIISLRKFIKGRRIEKIFQYNLDRIFIVQLHSTEGNPWLFIVEFFGGGNFILIDGEHHIVMAKHYVKTAKRDILPKKLYEFPSAKGIDFLSLAYDDFLKVMKGNSGELVRIIARNFNIGGYIAEEICLNAGIEKIKEVSSLTDQEMHTIYDKILTFNQLLRTQQFSPRLILDAQKNRISFEPLKYSLHAQYNFEVFPTFNQAIDRFFSDTDSSTIFSQNVQQAKSSLSKTEKILHSQKAKIDESKEIREESLEKAHIIFQYLNPLDNLINTIMFQRREKKREWEEITRILLEGKTKNFPECLLFDQLLPQEVMVQVNIEGTKFKLDLKKSAIDNATLLYDQAKKAKKKIEGAEKAIIETQSKIIEEKKQHDEIAANQRQLLRKPKQKWFEKFRWFFSSDGFLVVGGRDASSNEILVKKYMKGKDLFFHTETRGAPVCILQNPEEIEVPDLTIHEVANFGASYSSAWKHGWGNTEIYFVYPDQVSKSPKSGEYLTKGSFYITGKKNLLPKPYLELAIGVRLELIGDVIDTEHGVQNSQQDKIDEKEISDEKNESDSQDELDQDPIITSTDQNSIDINESDDMTEPDIIIEKRISLDQNEISENEHPIQNEQEEERQYYPRVIAGPVTAIKKQTKNYIILKPTKSRSSVSDTAKKVLKSFEKQAIDWEKKWVKLTSLNDIIRAFPPGESELIR